MNDCEVNRVLKTKYHRWPLVSVVIPCYNAEEWIYDCIHSVLQQDYPHLEVIVVDDASTDKSAYEILRHHASSIPVKMLTHKNNAGECVASANGFAEAKGEYICRLSADDMFVCPNHISVQVARMIVTEADWCYNSVNLSGKSMEEFELVASMWMPIPTRYFHSFFQMFDNFILRHPWLALAIVMNRNSVNSSTLMIRRSCYNGVKWCEKFRTDCDGMILMRLLLNRKIGVAIPKVGAFYRIHMGQGSYNPKYLEDMRNIRIYIRDKVLNGNYPLWLKARMKLI